MAAHPASPATLRLALLDCETTGLDPSQGAIIEVAVGLYEVARQRPETGRATNPKSGNPTVQAPDLSVASADPPSSQLGLFEQSPTSAWVLVDTYEGLHDPGAPLSTEISELTGLTDADLQGRSIDWPKVLALLDQADLLVAHNAAFDRAWLEHHVPATRGRRWACSLAHIDWKAHRCGCGVLRHLAFECQVPGAHGGHRAMHDVQLMAGVLQSRDPHPERGQRSYVFEMLTNAFQTQNLLEATGAPFENKDVLKAAGWRWSGTKKTWWKLVRGADVEDVVTWLGREVYQGESRHTLHADVDGQASDFRSRYGLE